MPESSGNSRNCDAKLRLGNSVFRIDDGAKPLLLAAVPRSAPQACGAGAFPPPNPDFDGLIKNSELRRDPSTPAPPNVSAQSSFRLGTS